MIIPAIDLINGQCVRLTQGRYDQQTDYLVSPVLMAQLYEKMGYKWLHIIDLDGAREGSLKNENVICEILANTNMKVQVGGGIRDLETISRLLEMGVNRVILGSVAVKNPKMVQEAIVRFGAERIVVAMDLKDDKIRISGWKETANLGVEEFLEQIPEVRIILCTDISRDGMQKGVNRELYE